MKNLLYPLMVACLMIASCNSTKNSNKGSSVSKGIKFKKSATLSAVLDQAAASNKLVFIDFYTSWCLPCKMMEEDVFSDKRIGKFFNDNFINYKVNAEKGNGVNLSYVYKIKAYPTIMFVDPKGNVIEQTIGAVYHTELMEMAERALASKDVSLND